MDDKPAALEALREEYGEEFYQGLVQNGSWTTEEVIKEFEITSFMAPFVVATRRSTNEKGTLMFIHSPRIYYNWRAK